MEFRDLKRQYESIKKDINKAINDVIESTKFIGGESVINLEKRLAEYVGVKHCITCGNGTDALSMVLSAWGITEGDAVFVPNFTFFATAEVVTYVGATPVFVDVDGNTFNMDSNHLEEMINKVIEKTNLTPKVIIPVDLFGLLANYDEISKIASKYNLLILEDGAQGFGAEYKGKKACSFGDAATTSFFPAKPLGCYGDGGAIFTNDDSLANYLKSYKVHGKGNDKYDNIRIGVNSRLDSIQAAILNVKLDAFIKYELHSVNEIYLKYNKLLSNYVDVPFIPNNYISSFAQYTIKLKSREIRDGLKNYLQSHNIPTMIYYDKTMHQQTAFNYLDNTDETYPSSFDLCDKVLSLPMHPYLEEEEIQIIAAKIIEYLTK